MDQLKPDSSSRASLINVGENFRRRYKRLLIMTTDNTHGKFDSESMTISLEEEPISRPKSKRSWLGFFRDILIYVMAYLVVSGITIGPYFWSWYGAVHADGSKWIARFYQPLAFLCEFCPPLGRLINAWVNWWIL